MIIVKVPARICFYGDHQDYLGLPVIAGAINRFIELRAEPIPEKEFQIHLNDIGTQKTILLDDDLQKVLKGDYFRAAIAILKKKGFLFNNGFKIGISGNIPLNAGLSSSSALVVAWIRFLVETQSNINLSNEEVGHLAYETEVLFFNQPGGLMDQYSIAQQGLLFIDTKIAKTQYLVGNLGKLVVAESGLKKQTQDVLKNARNYQEKAIEKVKRMTDFDLERASLADYERYLHAIPNELQRHWYAAIYNYDITKKAKLELEKRDSDLNTLAELMNQHQNILRECIQNTPVEMTKMMNSAIEAGAIAAKTIGSGGGGSMVAMVDEKTKDAVIRAFLNNGAKAAYEVELVA